LIQTGVLPLETEQVKEAMQRKTKPAFLASNLAAFELGYEAAAKAA
jgi:indolepyruvate ferredoxin oxidoreductase beta subunit